MSDQQKLDASDVIFWGIVVILLLMVVGIWAGRHSTCREIIKPLTIPIKAIEQAAQVYVAEPVVIETPKAEPVKAEITKPAEAPVKAKSKKLKITPRD